MPRALTIRELSLIVARTEPVVIFTAPSGLILGEPLWCGVYSAVPDSLLDRSVSTITASKQEFVIFIRDK